MATPAIPNLPQTKDELISKIIEMEWPMFTTVHDTAGRALCQDDHKTFITMRMSQFMAWDEATLKLYYGDVYTAMTSHQNLMTYKYGYMMEYTHPEEYEIIKEDLPSINMWKRQLIIAIVRQQIKWYTDVAQRFPNILRSGRPIRQSQAHLGDTSFEVYLRCELYTYSYETLESLWRYMQHLKADDKNLNEMILKNTAKLYGFDSIAAL